VQRTLTLQSAVTADAERVAQILIEVRSAFMPYARLAHSDDEVRAWVAGDLVPSGGTVVARFGDTTVGVMTTERETSCSWITQMAVDPQYVGRGIGSVLLQHTLRACPPPIRPFTFQANTGARRFYERHGFRAVRLSDGRANEERCPDVLYELVGERSNRLHA
jgi:GNAT superfamily N-acetyltransferase